MSDHNEKTPAQEPRYDAAAYSRLHSTWEAALDNVKKMDLGEFGLPRIDLPSMTITREIPHVAGMYVEGNVATRALVGAFRRLTQKQHERPSKRVVELMSDSGETLTLVDEYHAPGKKVITSGGRTARYDGAARSMYAAYLNYTDGSCEFSIMALGNDQEHPDQVIQRVTPQNKAHGVLIPSIGQVAAMDLFFIERGFAKPSESPMIALAQLIDNHSATRFDY